MSQESRAVEVRLIADTTAFTQAMEQAQRATKITAWQLERLAAWVDTWYAEHIRTHARPGDTHTRALRRTETTRRSSMHAAYRAKTRRRNRP